MGALSRNKGPIALPMPPSVNAIWRRGRGRTYLSPKYREWKDVCDVLYLEHRWLPVTGRFRAVITLDETKRRGDADNRVKAVLDWLERVQLIENDKLADAVTVQWGHAPEGCRVELTSSEEWEAA